MWKLSYVSLSLRTRRPGVVVSKLEWSSESASILLKCPWVGYSEPLNAAQYIAALPHDLCRFSNACWYVNKHVSFISASSVGTVSVLCDYRCHCNVAHFSVPCGGYKRQLVILLFSASSSEAAPVACGQPLSSLWWVPKWWLLRRETPSRGTTCCTFGPSPFMTYGALGPKSFMANSALVP